jgi:hypothetical protein
MTATTAASAARATDLTDEQRHQVDDAQPDDGAPQQTDNHADVHASTQSVDSRFRHATVLSLIAGIQLAWGVTLTEGVLWLLR